MRNYSNETNNEGIAKNIQFKIEIDNREFSFREYKNLLYDATYVRLRENENNRGDFQSPSPLPTYIEDLLQRATRNSRAFSILTAYKESEGSLIITFSYIIFSAFMNYGAFRESLDYVRDDLDYFLHRAYPDGTRINIGYTEEDNRVFSDIRNNIVSQVSTSFNREVRKLKNIVLLVGLFALGFSVYALYKVNGQPDAVIAPVAESAISPEILKSMVRSEIDKVNAEKINEELLNEMKQKKEEKKKGSRIN